MNKILFGLATVCLLLGASLPAFASGPGGGGTSGGGGSGGGSPTPTPAPAQTPVVSYSNFGAAAPAVSGTGYGTVGLQATGYYNLTADQFVATVSGTISKIRVPLQQYDTGGNGQFTIHVFANDPSVLQVLGSVIGPSPVSTIEIGAYQGQSARNNSTTLPVVNISNGARLVAGQTYWFEVQPSSQSREVWTVNQQGISTLHYYSDPNVTEYSTFPQGAFEISVLP